MIILIFYFTQAKWKNVILPNFCSLSVCSFLVFSFYSFAILVYIFFCSVRRLVVLLKVLSNRAILLDTSLMQMIRHHSSTELRCQVLVKQRGRLRWRRGRAPEPTATPSFSASRAHRRKCASHAVRCRGCGTAVWPPSLPGSCCSIDLASRPRDPRYTHYQHNRYCCCTCALWVKVIQSLLERVKVKCSVDMCVYILFAYEFFAFAPECNRWNRLTDSCGTEFDFDS